MARAVYISSSPGDLSRAQALGLGLVLDPNAKTPKASVSGAGLNFELAEPINQTQLAANLQTILDAEAQAQAVFDAQAANGQTLRQRAAAAVATNNTYVNITSPTTAQAVAQVKVLTKECTAVIKLLLNQTDDITGT